MSSKSTSHKRPITLKEKAIMRRTHLVLIPLVLIAALIVWVISMADSLPQAARIAAYIIAPAAVLIYGQKQIKLEKELRAGEVEVIRGVVTNKYKFGGKKRGGGGGISVSGGGRSSRGQATYILVIGEKKYWVRSKTYKKATKGAFSEMVWLPKSCYVISIQETNT